MLISFRVKINRIEDDTVTQSALQWYIDTNTVLEPGIVIDANREPKDVDPNNQTHEQETTNSLPDDMTPNTQAPTKFRINSPNRKITHKGEISYKKHTIQITVSPVNDLDGSR